MSDYKGKQWDRECAPSENPADQPKPPGNTECGDLPTSTPPEPKKPKPCPPDPHCQCPQGPSSTPSCFDDLIAKYAAALSAGDKAKTVKSDLEKRQRQLLKTIRGTNTTSSSSNGMMKMLPLPSSSASWSAPYRAGIASSNATSVH
jgi:hypothetical protein